MVDKENLSKLRYVYYVYQAEDTHYHVERYPIVYINSDLVYYKHYGNKYLQCIEMKYVRDSLSDYTPEPYIAPFSHKGNSFYWSMGNDYRKKLNEIVEEYEKAVLLRGLDRAERDMAVAISNYGVNIARYDKASSEESKKRVCAHIDSLNKILKRFNNE